MYKIQFHFCRQPSLPLDYRTCALLSIEWDKYIFLTVQQKYVHDKCNTTFLVETFLLLICKRGTLFSSTFPYTTCVFFARSFSKRKWKCAACLFFLPNYTTFFCTQAAHKLNNNDNPPLQVRKRGGSLFSKCVCSKTPWGRKWRKSGYLTSEIRSETMGKEENKLNFFFFGNEREKIKRYD